jgi:hypothetical protein
MKPTLVLMDEKARAKILEGVNVIYEEQSDELSDLSVVLPLRTALITVVHETWTMDITLLRSSCQRTRT